MISEQGKTWKSPSEPRTSSDGNLQKEGPVRDKQFVCMFITSSAIIRTAVTLPYTLDKSTEFELRSKLLQRQFLGNVRIYVPWLPWDNCMVYMHEYVFVWA